MKKRVLSMFMALALCLTLLPAPVWAEGETGTTAKETVRYMYYTYNGSQSSDYEASCAMLSSAAGDVVLTEQWYAVKGDVTINGTVTVTDTHQVNLILCDGATLTITGGLMLGGGASAPQLTVYGQTGETGKMLVTNSKGGYALYTDDNATAYIRLRSGTLTATGQTAAFQNVACWNTKDDYTPNDPMYCDGDPAAVTSVTVAPCDCLEDYKNFEYKQRTGYDMHRATCKRCGFILNWDGTENTGYQDCDFYNCVSDGAAGHHWQCVDCGNKRATEVHDFQNGYCTACRDKDPNYVFSTVAQIGDKEYTSLQEALDAAGQNDTVVLAGNVTSGTLPAIVRNQVTLNLNGYTVDELMVGQKMDLVAGKPLDESIAGDLTVVGGGKTVYGKIDNLDFVFGTLDIQDGVIGTNPDLTAGEDGMLSCEENSGEVTISGGIVYGMEVNEGASVTVSGGDGHKGRWTNNGGTLTITGGSFDSVTFSKNTGTIAISGGTFGTITNINVSSSSPLMPLLADNYAFYQGDNAQDGNATELADVTVKEHTHSFENGKCDCGVAAIVVDNNNSCYNTLQAALGAAANNASITSVTLGQDLTEDVTFNGSAAGSLTLNMNGHKLEAEAGVPLTVTGGTLRIEGAGEINQNTASNATAFPAISLTGGKLVITGDLTAQGGYDSSSGRKPAIRAEGEGELDLQGNVSLNGGLTMLGKAKLTNLLTKGTFYAQDPNGNATADNVLAVCVQQEGVVSNNYNTVLKLIADGYAIYKTDGTVRNAAISTLTSDTYSIGAHTCNYTQDEVYSLAYCNCGRSHAHRDLSDEKSVLVNGVCPICGYHCPHKNIGGDGMCETCGTQFAVLGDDGKYYKHLADALAESSVDDVTLLADDTLSTDVRLERDIMFFPNGHTVSGGGSIVVPSGKRLTFHGNENGETGNAGTIRMEVGGTLRVDEDFTGTVQTLTVSETADIKLSGGTYGTITGSRQKAGTLLNYNTVTGEKYFAFQKQDGTFARYDQRITSETPLKNVTVVGCPDKQLTEACGETCEYCGGALRCRIGAAGYRDMSAAIRDVPDGGTITLLRDYSAVTNISANVDRAYTIDLNGHSVRKNSDGISLAVYAGTPKIIDSKGGGVIAGLEIDSTLGLTLADLLPEGYTFKSGSTWITDLTGKELTNVSMAKIPIKSMDYPTEMSMTYGGTGTLLVNVTKETGTGAVSFQWYKVENGNETAVGSATTKNQFDLSAQKLSAGKHIFRFSATCDGYEKMSEDIVVTVQKADIRSITPPTALENLTYTGQEQALITAGSVTSGGTMQYSLTENGTYSPDIPVGTDAGTYTVWYRVIGDANHNDTAPASVEVSIGKKPLTISGVTAVSKPYDGTTNAGITSVTFEGSVTLQKDKDYAVTANFDDASVGNGKNITATVTLMGQAAKNYVLEQSNFMTTGSITKAAAPDFTKETVLTIVNGHEKTYTVTLPALPTLKTPKEYGAPTYELGGITLDGNYYTGGAKVENGKLILPIQKNDVETTGSVGTVSVVIKSTNYEDITLTVNVNATNKIVPTGEPTLSAKTLTYGQALSAIKLSGKLRDNVNNKDIEGTFTWADGTIKPNAGSYEAAWKFTPTDGDTYAETTGTVSITVTKATPTGEPIYTRITAANKTLKDAALKPNTSWPTGTIQWVDKDGKKLPDTTEVKANTAYKWIFTPTDADAANYTTATGELTLYSVSTGGGGGGGSSSGSTVKTDTTTKPDGTKVQTETRADGTKIQTETKKDGSTVKTTTNPNGSSVTVSKDAAGSTGTVKTDKNGQTEAKTALSSKAIEDAKKSGEPVKAPVEVKATRDSDTAPTVKVELPKGAGETKVEIPVSNVKPGTVAVLVHADGTEEIVKNSLPTEDGIQLTVNGGATVKIVDNSKDFIDTRNHWAKDAIDFVSARGLVNGMNDSIYAPNASTTRAQLWTILARQNDADLTGGANWYEKAQLWSKDKGISDGTQPDAAINRAQMVTMLWRAAGSPAAQSGTAFQDVAAGSYYAQAVAWAVEGGITAGVGGGRFDPAATCTRAQIAAFLARSMK